MPAGGSGLGITINGRYFPLDADSDVNIQLSGTKNETKPNGDGSFRIVKTIVLGMAEGLKIQIDDARQDLEFLRDVANKNEAVDFDYTKVDGTIYSGSVQIIDDIKSSSKEATADIKVSGTLEQQ